MTRQDWDSLVILLIGVAVIMAIAVVLLWSDPVTAGDLGHGLGKAGVDSMFSLRGGR